ncbi:MAG: acyloxyacyl hydrolase [Pseudomonadales bacterium]
MRNASLILLLLISALASGPTRAETGGPHWGLSVASGQGAMGQRHDSWRVAGQRSWKQRWWQHRYWHFTGYWDLGLTIWDASGETGGPTDRGAARIYALGLGPVLRWQFEPLGSTTIAPFLELGVGFSLLSDSALRSGKRRSLALGSHWQFEDRGVVGVRFGARGRFELAYQRMHHSNLNLASSNHGVDSHLLMLGYRF